MVVLMTFDVAEIHGNTQTTIQKLVNFIILKLDKSTISESEIGLKMFGISEMAKKSCGISELGPPLGTLKNISMALIGNFPNTCIPEIYSLIFLISNKPN